MLREKLFSNIGKKLKTLSLVSFFIDVIILTIGMCVLFVILFDEELFGLIPGIICIPLYVLMAWILSTPLYAFGELVEKISSIENHLTKNKSQYIVKDNAIKKVNISSIEKIDKLFAEGLITEKEYNEAKASSEVVK